MSDARENIEKGNGLFLLLIERRVYESVDDKSLS